MTPRLTKQSISMLKSSPKPNIYDTEAQVLCMANYCISVFKVTHFSNVDFP